jgi:hypothetical protein
MKIDAYGRLLEVTHENGQWVVYSLGEGKRRREVDLVIPAHLTTAEIVGYLEDLLHEVASVEHPRIKILSER